MNNIPVRPRRPGKYTLTDQDKADLSSLAVNGVIPFDLYIPAVNRILNRGMENIKKSE